MESSSHHRVIETVGAAGVAEVTVRLELVVGRVDQAENNLPTLKHTKSESSY